MQDYAKLYRTIKDYTGLNRTIWEYKGLYKTIENYVGLNRTIHNYDNHDMRTNEEFKVNFARGNHISKLNNTLLPETLKLYRTIYDDSGLRRTIKYYRGLYMTT